MIVRRLWILTVLGLILAGAAAARSVFVVDQTSQAIVERLGRPVRVINPPGQSDAGLKFKAPWDQVVRLDKRDQGFDADPIQVASVDQQRLVVQPVLRYRIADALAFTDGFDDGDAVRERLNRLIVDAVRQTLGQATMADIVAGRQDVLMAQAAQAVSAQAKALKLGVEVIDLRLRRVELPDASAQTVYQRMKSEREQQAAQVRAWGNGRKREIMAGADAQVATITAEGDAAAAKVRADGDAQRAAIFAASYGRDPSLAAFYKALMAYDATLAKGDTTFVLSPDSPFLKYMKDGPAGR